jgi:hypothetical protein
MGVLIALAVLAFSILRFTVLQPATFVIAGLRILFLLLLGWCLFLPNRRNAEISYVKPRFVVALDATASMKITPGEGINSRWRDAQAVIHMPWVDVVSAECEVDAYPIRPDLGNQISIAGLTNLQADANASYLRNAMVILSQRYAGQNVSGMLLLSDGLDTREALDDWAAGDWPWPIYTASFESAEDWQAEPDVRVDTVKTPRRVVVDWQTELKTIVSGQGTRGQPINVRLLKDGVIASEEPTVIPEMGGSRELNFTLDHSEIGTFTYAIHVPPLPGETHTNDNTYMLSVQVVDARNQLLYVEGAPRWESKYLTRTLKKSSQVTPLVFLRGPGGKFLTIGQRGNASADMTTSELANFKIVVVGDLESTELGDARAQNLVNFVDQGGSLILLGGARAWGSRGYSQTALKKVLPVKSHGNVLSEGKFPSSLTDTGRSHPAFAGDPAIWEAMPPVLSYVPGVELTPGAQALATASDGGSVHPIIATQRYGQGKVIAILTDSLWRWSLSIGTASTKPYGRFVEQLMVWMSPAEDAIQAAKVELFSDREEVYLGETLDLSARLGRKLNMDRADTQVTCAITDAEDRTLPFSMQASEVVTSSGTSFPGYISTFKADQPGLYTATAIARSGTRELSSEPITFYVRPFTPESIPKPVDAELLRTLAKSSGGQFFESKDALNAALSGLTFATQEQESVEFSSLWRTLVMLSCLTLLLAIEWILRRVKNLP